MGIFSKIWDFFVSPIVLKKEKPNELVIPVRLNSSRVKLNKRIEVPDDWWLVVTVKDKICDILQAGTYKANENDLPITTRTGNALKKNKQGNVIPWIKCSLYYVRKNEISNHLFRAGLPFIVKTEHLGRVKGKVEGAFSVSVSNPELFLKCLFMEYYKIGRSTALSFVRNLVVEEINAILEHKEDVFEKLIIDVTLMSEMMNNIIPKHLNNIGVSVKSIQIQSFVLSKKVQGIMSEFLATYRPQVAEYGRVVTSDGQLAQAVDEKRVEELIAQASSSEQKVSETVSTLDDSVPDLEQVLKESVKPQLVDNTNDNAFLFERMQNSEHQNKPDASVTDYIPRRRGTVDLELTQTQLNDRLSRRGEQDILDFPSRNREELSRQTFDFTREGHKDEEYPSRRRTNDVLLEEDRQNSIATNETSKRDIFAGTSDKKQCKYCDKLIGIEYQFCPFCGFKQDK